MRLPDVTSLAVGRGNSADTMLAGLTFGAMLSTDGGQHFEWICEEALLGPTNVDLWVAVVDPRTLLVANAEAGLAISEDGGCTFRAEPAFKPPFRLRQLSQHALDRRRLLVVGDVSGGESGQLWQSDDGGASFERVADMPKQVFVSAIATSVARPQALWLAGVENGAPQTARLLMREPDGNEFRVLPVPGAPPLSTAAWLAVDPQDANCLLAGFLDLTTNGTQLLRSIDGARSWTRVLLVREPLRDLAFTADGVVWVTGTTRTFRSWDRGASFDRLERPSYNACMASSEGRHWLCGDESLGDGATLLRSNDRGRSLRPAMHFAEMTGPYRCPKKTPVSELCRPLWPQAAQRLGARVPPPKATKRP